MRNSKQRERFNFYFSRFFFSINKLSILTRRLDTSQSSLDTFLIFPNFLRSLVLSFLITCEQLVYTMFINNNRVSLHLWWKESLVKHQKVSKYYKNNYLQNFLLIFKYLATAPIVKNSNIYARIYFTTH